MTFEHLSHCDDCLCDMMLEIDFSWTGHELMPDIKSVNFNGQIVRKLNKKPGLYYISVCNECGNFREWKEYDIQEMIDNHIKILKEEKNV